MARYLAKLRAFGKWPPGMRPARAGSFGSRGVRSRMGGCERLQ